MRKLKRTEVLRFKQELYKRQGGVCPLCNKELPTEMAKTALDHCHVTGECRGLLHLSCNRAEGIIFRAVATWGGQTRDYDQTAAYLTRLVDYLSTSKTGVIYHLHKTEEEKREERNRKAREARARAKAKAVIAKRGN